MYKKLGYITIIILINLFAFLLFWNILGALFWNKEGMIIGSIIVSIIPLVIFLYYEIWKVTTEFKSIKNKEDNDWGIK